MKVTLITVVFNGEKFLADCIESVIAQTHKDIEYIVIDGGSKDNSVAIIEKYRSNINYFVSEKDKGMYDALNKGIAVATGDVIGILNADDMLATKDTIANIVQQFELRNADGVYGNLNYIDPDKQNKIIRKWISKPFDKRDISLGWMPAHPTLYLKRDLFAKYGNYSLNFGTAADYEFMLRYLYHFKVNAVFLNELVVDMRIGGMSNASLKHRYHAMLNDYKAIKANQIPFPLLTLALKKASKLRQFLH